MGKKKDIAMTDADGDGFTDCDDPDCQGIVAESMIDFNDDGYFDVYPGETLGLVGESWNKFCQKAISINLFSFCIFLA